MASTLADPSRIAWTYTTDAPAVDYVIGAVAAFINTPGTAAKVGGAAATAELESIPNELKPRKVKCVDAAGHARWVTCYTTTATLWTTPGTAILLNFHGVDTSFQSTVQKRAEKRGRPGKNPNAA